jgi:acyl-[acyl-carrier-protein] desaturase
MQGQDATPQPKPDEPELLAAIYRLFRDFFDKAERRRRWSIPDDIPWQQCNRTLDPAIADVVETFCSVELYLPDYLSKLIPQVRGNRGRAWFLANWGYEESKHSIALGDWLLKSGHRSEEQMTDMEARVFEHEWNLPQDNARGMVCYSMFQELATWLHYRNLRSIVRERGGDPALEKLLTLVSVDERAHYDFFQELVQLYLAYDRPGTLEQMRRVANDFAMPAYDLLADSAQREAAVQNLHIFDEKIFLYEVFEPCLAEIGVSKAELRRKNARREQVSLAGVVMG